MRREPPLIETQEARMQTSIKYVSLVLLACLLIGSRMPGQAQQASRPAATPKIDFQEQVLPLLRAHCFQCHGPSQQSGGLRLDTGAFAMKGGVSGKIIVPGKGAQSLLVRRLTGVGGLARMPMGFAPLTSAEVTAVRSWIDQGAV